MLTTAVRTAALSGRSYGEDSMSDDQPAPVTVPPDDELETAFSPYITAAGQVVHHWNQLQESLGKLFAAVTEKGSMALAIWYTPHSDRAQRDMLTAAIHETSDDKWSRYSNTAKADILALVSEANSLADRRNDAIHAPVSLAIDKRKLVPIPVYFRGNPRALKLKDKDIIKEFNACVERARTLNEYAEKLETAINFSAHYAWPDIPTPLETKRKKSWQTFNAADLRSNDSTSYLDHDLRNLNFLVLVRISCRVRNAV